MKEIILLDFQNNYVERLSIDDNAAKSFNILATNLNILHNYDRTKLFSDLYVAKFLNTSVKLVFPCKKLFAFA